MSAQSNITASIGCAMAISSRLDSIEAIQGQILEKVSLLESRIDAINNAIDSLENVLVTTINSIKDVLLAAIDAIFLLLQQLLSLLGGGNNNDLDKILQAISAAKSEINNNIGTQHNQTRESISACCNSLSAQLSTAIGLLNQLLAKNNDNDLAAILAAITASTVAILAAIGALAAVTSSGFAAVGATLAQILAAILASKASDLLGLIGKILDLLNKLLGKGDCDLQPVIQAINSCCSSIQGSITQINSSITQLNSTVNQVSSKVDTVNSTVNTINSTTSNISSTVNTINSTTSNISSTVNTINSTTSNISSTVNNISSNLSNISSQLTNIYNSILNAVNNINNSSNTINNSSNTINNISNDIQNITTTIDTTTNEIINHITNQISNIELPPIEPEAISGSLSITNCDGDIITAGYTTIPQMVSILNSNINYLLSQVCLLENTQIELVEITIPVFLNCDINKNPIYTSEVVAVPKGLEDTELLKFQRIAEIEGKQCANDAIALMPEWWQVRVEGGIPQFILAFGEVNAVTGKCTHAKYVITIPHFKNIKPNVCPVPRYKKGNYELIAYFKDNSKLIINAYDEQECERVYRSILPWIEESYLATIKYKVGKRVSFQFQEIWVCPKFGKFFSQGNRNLNPDWTVNFV